MMGKVEHSYIGAARSGDGACTFSLEFQDVIGRAPNTPDLTLLFQSPTYYSISAFLLAAELDLSQATAASKTLKICYTANRKHQPYFCGKLFSEVETTPIVGQPLA